MRTRVSIAPICIKLLTILLSAARIFLLEGHKYQDRERDDKKCLLAAAARRNLFLLADNEHSIESKIMVAFGLLFALLCVLQTGALAQKIFDRDVARNNATKTKKLAGGNRVTSASMDATTLEEDVEEKEQATIQVSQNCYTKKEDVVLHFRNVGAPLKDDWIGIYPSDYHTTEEPVFWVSPSSFGSSCTEQKPRPPNELTNELSCVFCLPDLHVWFVHALRQGCHVW